MSFIVNRAGETPLDDVSELKVPVGTRSELNQLEAANILTATIKHLGTLPNSSVAPFDLGWMRQVHFDMFGEVWGWAGRLRGFDVNIGVPWFQVETRLYDLCERIPYWSAMPPVEAAALLHWELVAIHPFHNGNGRWSRLVSNVRLLMTAGRVVVWPGGVEAVDSPIRAE
jgi:fido (protein-threonine AMPylation protein)